MKKQNTKTPWVFYVGLILLCCFLISVHGTSSLYAKYMTIAEGSDEARVAKLDVQNSIVSSSFDANIDLNFFDSAKLTDTVEFNVVSNSEVAIKYDVVIVMPEPAVEYNWLDVKIKLNVGGVVVEKTPDILDNVFIFPDIANIAANDSTAIEHDLIFKITDSCQGFPPSGLDNIVDTTAQIIVHAEQID